jgi:hypothetical protein
MKIALKISVVAIIVALISFSCKKNQIGGKATLKGVVMHHDKPIGDAYVYIKYNSTEFPGDDYKLYDAYVQADANGNYSISFYKGTYYIFATGRDIDIPSPFTVNGGITVTLKNKEHLSKDIAVTEP